jgi:hypothetical protein
MAERLTDAALGRMESYVMVTRDHFGRFSTNDVEALLQEIRESRSASLTAEDREALECLAKNLATAGALCEAYRQGSSHTVLMLLRVPSWRPGCNLPAPGKGERG